MADLAFQHHGYFGFDNTGNFTTANFDTTGDTWCVFCVGLFSATIANITIVTYNGTDINTANAYTNPGTPAGGPFGHVTNDIVRFYYFALGADAGNHAFNIQWTGGGYFDFLAISGNGSIDAAIIDGAIQSTDDVALTGTCTFTPYTPTTNKALPIFVVVGGNGPSFPATMSANANCTLGEISTLNDYAVFYGPLSTPAGTATSAVINDPTVEFIEPCSFALKPTAGANTDTTWMVRQQRPMANFFPTIVKVP